MGPALRFENARRARDDFFGDQNNRKRYDGYVAALLDPEIWRAIEAREKKLRDAISREPKLKSTLGRVRSDQESAGGIGEDRAAL